VANEAEGQQQKQQQTMNKKMSFKAELFTSNSEDGAEQKKTPNAEMNVVYEVATSSKGRYNNSLSVRAVISDHKQQQPFVLCLKAESDYPQFRPTPGDALNIDAYDRPPSARGSADLVMAQVNSTFHQVIAIYLQ
jgi:hypothetical protein